ncbi:uncharacterized protein [Temnothorax nylanderi]|uniref:uncharacterized protein n=1 Tax=Temnothorax nylanderi TaxID=102681 RepID=UPI003A8927E4
MVLKLGLVIMITLASCVAHKGYSYVRPNKQLSYDRGYGYEGPRDQWSNDDGIPGIAGKDYPIFHQVPWTRFVCEWRYPGYYADPEADCQAYHICQRGGRKDSFLCPNGTLFNQERLVCTWWYTVDCSRAQSFYSINEAVAKAMEEADRRIRIGEQKLSWNYQRECNEDRYWNKNWQSERRGWNRDSASIRHNHDLGFPKRLPNETPARPKFSVKSLPKHRPTVYLPV